MCPQIGFRSECNSSLTPLGIFQLDGTNPSFPKKQQVLSLTCSALQVIPKSAALFGLFFLNRGQVNTPLFVTLSAMPVFKIRLGMRNIAARQDLQGTKSHLCCQVTSKFCCKVGVSPAETALGWSKRRCQHPHLGSSRAPASSRGYLASVSLWPVYRTLEINTLGEKKSF